MLIRVDSLPAPPARSPDAHKGTFGRVLIIGGSRSMSGAAALAGMAALRGGAGLVFLAVPASSQPVVAGFEPSYQALPLPDDDQGRFAATALPALKALTAKHTALAVGPGLGQSPALEAIVADLFLTAPTPAVFDADALNALARLPDVWSSRSSLSPPRILTPHPGEFARLTGRPCPKSDAEREAAAADFARERHVVLLLKGHRTLITDGQRLAVNRTGNPGMATGGTGDVLTGLIAALLAQQMPPFEAAQLGAHLHGLAGDLAAAELSEPALIASDLPRYLGPAWRHHLSSATPSQGT